MLIIGNGLSNVSPSSVSDTNAAAFAIGNHRLWLRGTPFGVPVVPDVQQMVKISSAVIGLSLAYNCWPSIVSILCCEVFKSINPSTSPSENLISSLAKIEENCSA